MTAAAGTATTVAAFDFDGTVTRGGSVVPFLIWLRGRTEVARAVAALSPSLVRGALVGGARADLAKERLFARLLAGLAFDEAAERSKAFAERHLEARLRPEVAARLAWHRQRGHAVVLVSASPELYVGPAGDLLGVDAVLATRLHVDRSGRLTGYYEGRNCRGAEKYGRLAAWLSERQGSSWSEGSDRPVLWAYGNSRGDLQLLEAADHGVDAGMLRRLGRLRRFTTLAEVTRTG